MDAESGEKATQFTQGSVNDLIENHLVVLEQKMHGPWLSLDPNDNGIQKGVCGFRYPSKRCQINRQNSIITDSTQIKKLVGD